MKTRLESILQRGCNAGVFDISDRKLTTLAVIAMLNGVNTWYRPDGRLSVEEIQGYYLALVRRAVCA